MDIGLDFFNSLSAIWLRQKRMFEDCMGVPFIEN